MTRLHVRRPSFSARAAIGVGALASLLLAGCALTPIHLERETRALRIEHLPASAIEVRTTNGSVEVIAEPGAADVSITADLRAQTLDRLERTSIVALRDAAGLLRISVDWADGKALNSEGCDFDITLPDAAGADIQTSNARVHLQGLSGTALVRSSNGKLEIARHAGNIDAATSNAGVFITDPAGEIRARTSNGAIEVQNAPARVDADTSNGRITIVLTDDSRGPVVADTSNARISFTVGKSFAGRLSLTTSNARITADESLGAHTAMRTIALDKRSGTIEFGEAGAAAASSCTTSNGAIEIHSRGN